MDKVPISSTTSTTIESNKDNITDDYSIRRPSSSYDRYHHYPRFTSY